MVAALAAPVLLAAGADGFTEGGKSYALHFTR